MARSSKRSNFLTLVLVVMVGLALLYRMRPARQKPVVASPPMEKALASVPEESPAVVVENPAPVRDEIAESGAVHQATPDEHPFFLLPDSALEDQWDDQVRAYLKEVDPEGADKLIYEYENSRSEYRSPLTNTLAEGFRALEGINNKQHLKEKEIPVQVHAEHFQSLRWALGPHYGELEERRRMFLHEHPITER